MSVHDAAGTVRRLPASAAYSAVCPDILSRHTARILLSPAAIRGRGSSARSCAAARLVATPILSGCSTSSQRLCDSCRAGASRSDGPGRFRLDGSAMSAHTYPVCHREEHGDVAISLPKETRLPSQDRHAPLAMTVRLKLGTHEGMPRVDNGYGFALSASLI